MLTFFSKINITRMQTEAGACSAKRSAEEMEEESITTSLFGSEQVSYLTLELLTLSTQLANTICAQENLEESREIISRLMEALVQSLNLLEENKVAQDDIDSKVISVLRALFQNRQTCSNKARKIEE
jgi:hypothetical protein